MSPGDDTEDRLVDIADRLRAKGLFGAPHDALSLRVPGRNEMLLLAGSSDACERVQLDGRAHDETALHEAIYRARPDAGGMLFGGSTWARALGAMGIALPSLFDEQARHIGPTEAPVPEGETERAARALLGGGNALVVGDARVVIGTTPNRVVLNADLFEKCAKAFVIAHAGGPAIRTLPRWVEARWYDRLRRDQKRAAESLEHGKIPEGMDAY